MARDPKFYRELKSLNEDFYNFIDNTYKKSPYYDWTPTLVDYIRQFNEINEKYPEKSQSNQVNNKSRANHIPTKNVPPTQTLQRPSQQSQPLTQPKQPSASTPKAPLFSFGTPAKPDQPIPQIQLPIQPQLQPTNQPQIQPTNQLRIQPQLQPQVRTQTPIRTPTQSPPQPQSQPKLQPQLQSPLQFQLQPQSPVQSQPQQKRPPPPVTQPQASLFSFNAGNITSQAPQQQPLASAPKAPLFGFNAGAKQNDQPQQQLSFASPPKAPLFSFNAGATAPNNNFSFGTAYKNLNTTNNTSFGVGTTNHNDTTIVNNTIDSTTNNEADDEESAPPEPNVDKYEEPNAKFQIRCKLYKRGQVADGTASISLLGCGFLFVKSMDATNNLQIIFRQEPDLRKVLLNEVITPQLPIKQVQKTVQMITPGQNGETKFHFVKVRDEKSAAELLEVLKTVKQ